MLCKALKMATAAILITTFSGCETVRYQSTPLPLPPRPILPAIKAAELQCLSNQTYSDIAQRDLLRRQYEQQLELVIKSTHKEN